MQGIYAILCKLLLLPDSRKTNFQYATAALINLGHLKSAEKPINNGEVSGTSHHYNIVSIIYVVERIFLICGLIGSSIRNLKSNGAD